MIGAYYDIEIFSNYISFLFVDMENDQNWIDMYIDADINKDIKLKEEALSHIKYKVFILHDDRNDALAFYEFMSNIKLLIGYNSIRFDNLLIDFMYIIKDTILGNPAYGITKLKTLANEIISNNNIYFKYFNDELKAFQEFYTSIDLLMALFETVNKKSLKQAAINIKWYRIEDLPMHPDAFVSKEDFSKIFDYNMNDVLITRALHIHKTKEIQLRIKIGAKYSVNVLSSNRSTTADKLMAKFYSQYTGLRYFQFKDLRTIRTKVDFIDIINPKIYFKDPILQKVLDDLKNTTFYIGREFEKTIIYKDKGYTLATGGLHSIDRPGWFETTDDIIIRDADVSSYYPRLIENEGVCPSHIAPVAFASIVHMITNDRIEYKHKAKQLKKQGLYTEAEDYQVAADALKIVANSGLFGKLGYDGWLHDYKAFYQVTLNGQLYLMMLIEQLEANGIEVISANTDGVLSKFTKDKSEIYGVITSNWQAYTKLELEFADYLRYVRTSVNDYIAIKKEWSDNPDVEDAIKRKGDFQTEVELSKAFNAPIVAIAIDNFIVNNVPINDTILNHKDIYDFCISVKTGNEFKKQLHDYKNGQFIIEELSKNLRYFVSTNGGTLIKSNGDKIINMNKGFLVTPFNNFYKVSDIKEYNINYQYYIKRCNDILYKIEGVYKRPGASRRFTGSKKKGITQIGKLFD